MYAYCSECGYQSSKADCYEELKKVVKNDGGQIKNSTTLCPQCLQVDTLNIKS